MVTKFTGDMALGWAVGFYEGEGSVGTYGTRGIHFSICQKDKEPLIDYQEWLDSMAIRSKLNNRKGFWYLIVTRYTDILKIYQMFAPYLSERREEQFSNALEDFLSVSIRHGYGKLRAS